MPPHSSKMRRSAFSLFSKSLVIALIAFAVGAALVFGVRHTPDEPEIVIAQAGHPVFVPPPVVAIPEAAPSIGVSIIGEGESLAPTPLIQYEEKEPVRTDSEPEQANDSTPAVLPEIAETPLPPPAEERPVPNGKKRIAIVIDDVGPDRHGSAGAIALPAAVTLAFLPYSETLSTQVAAARAAHHQIIVHMPMEPEDVQHNYPGPQALLVNLSSSEISTRVASALRAVEGEVGLNNHMGSRFTTSLASMQPVMEQLAEHRLFFLDSRTTADSVGETLARRYGVRYVARDVFIDNTIDPASIRHQLEQVVKVADRHGQAVAIGHPHAETIEALRSWIPQMQRRGYSFVPVGDLARRLPAETGKLTGR